MILAYTKTALLIFGITTLGNLFVTTTATGLSVTPPNVLDSDLYTCECYQEEAYPIDCPLSTPQLEELCSNITIYQYNQTLTEDFCNQSCLEALTSCYQQHPGNCSTNVLEYYTSSFCSRNQKGEYCVSVGYSALEMLSGLATSCSDGDDICPLPPATCSLTCRALLNFAVGELGCCAPSLFDHPLSPFANFSIGNPNAYANCGVDLGEECPEYVEPSSASSIPSPSVENGEVSTFMFTPSPVPASSKPSPNVGNGGDGILKSTTITLVSSVVGVVSVLYLG